MENWRQRVFAAKNERYVESAARTSLASAALSSSARIDRKSAWKWSAYSSTSASQSPSISPRARWRYTNRSFSVSPRAIRRLVSNITPSYAFTNRTARAKPSHAGITPSVAPASSKPFSTNESNEPSNSPEGSFHTTMRRTAVGAKGCANLALSCACISI